MAHNNDASFQSRDIVIKNIMLRVPVGGWVDMVGLYVCRIGNWGALKKRVDWGALKVPSSEWRPGHARQYWGWWSSGIIYIILSHTCCNCLIFLVDKLYWHLAQPKIYLTQFISPTSVFSNSADFSPHVFKTFLFDCNQQSCFVIIIFSLRLFCNLRRLKWINSPP